MSQEFENLIIKRKVTPDPSRRDTSNLDIMQNKLRIAAETIEAMKKERDNIKISVKSFNEKFPTTESSTKETSEEAEELKKVLKSKEKTIETLEKQLRNQKIKQIDVKTLIETCEKLKNDLVSKEKHIIYQEKIIRDLKTDLLSQSLQSENNQMIEKLKSQLSELLKEKKHWAEVFEFILNIAEESGKTKSIWEKPSNQWKIVLETVDQMKTSINEKEKLIKQLMQNSSKEKLKKLKETNKNLLNELEKSRKPTLKPGFLFDLTEACSIFIQTVHSSQFLYFPFKKHLTSSKSFKGMIEKSQFEEALLRILMFLQEILQFGQFSLQRPEEDSDSQEFYTSHTPKNQKLQKNDFFEDRPRFYSPCQSARGFDEAGSTGFYRIPGSTQGNPGFSSAPNIPRVQRFQEPRQTDHQRLILSNKSQQTSLDTRCFRPKEEKINSKASKEVQTKPSSIINLESSGIKSGEYTLVQEKQPIIFNAKSKTNQETSIDPPTPSSPEAQGGLIQIFDESEQLLSIIDKQNSRLARIGNQISQLVPEKIESVDEPSSESSSNSEAEKEKYHYLVTSPNHTEFQEGTFGRKPSSNQETSENSKISAKGRSEQDKYIKVVGRSGNELEVSSVPGFSDQSRVEKTTIEREGTRGRRLLGPGFELEGQLSEEFKRLSIRSTPPVPGTDFYHRREENNENSDSDERHHFKGTHELKPGYKTSEYWNSVVDYFSQKDDSN